MALPLSKYSRVAVVTLILALTIIQYTCIYILNGVSAEAVVGLERTIFTVFEDVGRVELCAHVFEPDIECPIEFPFDVVLSTADRTAGM